MSWKRFGNVEIILQDTEEWVALTKSSTQDAAFQAINDYKKLADFKQEVIEGSVDACWLGFFDCKEQVS